MAIKLKQGFVLRKIGPQYMAVPFGPMTTRVKGMISLSESGYMLWQAMEKGADTKEALVVALLAEYDVDEAEAAADVEEFLEFLGVMGVIEA
jgi:hypothetical protein